MRKNIIVHIPHSSLYIPDDYKNTSLLQVEELEAENLLMCDFRIDELLEDKSQAIIFPYSRLYCDVERFRDDSEIMNQYGMGYIYTKTSKGKEMFEPNEEHIKEIDEIYHQHHQRLDDEVTRVLNQYGSCIIIDLHAYSLEAVLRLFDYKEVPDICIGIEKDYYSEELTQHFINYFEKNGYTVAINYPYQGSFVPNQYYGKKENDIISIMIEVNKRVYENDFEHFKKIINKALDF